MMKILIISHGELAHGMHSTLTDFFGISNIYYAKLSLEKGTEGLIMAIEAYLKEWKNEQVVICSDLKAGSANQIAFKYLKRPETYLISGMNLALLLQLGMSDKINTEILKQYIASSQDDIALVNDVILSSSEDDE